MAEQTRTPSGTGHLTSGPCSKVEGNGSGQHSSSRTEGSLPNMHQHTEVGYAHRGHLGNSGEDKHVSYPDNQVAPDHAGGAAISQGEDARPGMCETLWS